MRAPFNFAFSAFVARTRAFADIVLREKMPDQRGRLKYTLLILRLRPTVSSINAPSLTYQLRLRS